MPNKKTDARRITFASLLVLCVGATSCGGLSAPTIDLPPPLTGRITENGGDIDTLSAGNLTINAPSGSVSAYATVRIINESVEVLSNLGSKQVSELDDCGEDTRTCTTADASGAFTAQIDAGIGAIVSIGEFDTSLGDYVGIPIYLEIAEHFLDEDTTLGDAATDVFHEDETIINFEGINTHLNITEL